MNNKLISFKGMRVFAFLFLLIGIYSCSNLQTNNVKESNYTQLEEFYKRNLELSIMYFDSLLMSRDIGQSKEFFLKSRNAFKMIEPILAAIDKNNYKSINAPNILQVHEEDATDIKINQPFGYQVIEENLFTISVDTSVVHETTRRTRNRLSLIYHNTRLKLEKRHILRLLRDEIIRIATTGITGFDSPVLARSLEESKISYQSMITISTIFRSNFMKPQLYQKWMQSLAASRDVLIGDFETFDRYGFIQNHTQNQIALWQELVKDWDVDLQLEFAISNDAISLFSSKTFAINYFSPYVRDTLLEQKGELGKSLFNDPGLSSSGTMSCSTCHINENAFTENRSIAKNQKRNTPTLLYVGYQKGFFYDKRVGNIEGQITHVIHNETEFDMDMDSILTYVSSKNSYVNSFSSYYKEGITSENIRNAIASYIRKLASFDSKFDQNMNQKRNDLTEEEIEGFNLFMGIAACATCHFPPLFNGTVPPDYKDSELENLGVPETKEGLALDDDLGRYDLFHTAERKHFFKTPTIRNIELTAPYMHNGVYNSLEEVMEFYNNGGGLGLGLENKYQTLPPDSLNLSQNEIKAIISFMKTLTDSEFEIN